MSQVEITFELSEFIAARIADDSRKDSGFAAVGALPLYIDIGGMIGIRPDGTLVEWSHDGEDRDVRPVEDRVWVLIALIAAARRYPEFQDVLPVRGTGAIDCDCRRIPSCVSGLISCARCGGMGRLSPGDLTARLPGRTGRPARLRSSGWCSWSWPSSASSAPSWSSAAPRGVDRERPGADRRRDRVAGPGVPGYQPAAARGPQDRPGPDLRHRRPRGRRPAAHEHDARQRTDPAGPRAAEAGAGLNLTLR